MFHTCDNQCMIILKMYNQHIILKQRPMPHTKQQQWLGTLCSIRICVFFTEQLSVSALVSTSQPWMPGYLLHVLNISHRPDKAKATRNLPMSQPKNSEQKYFISQEDIPIPGVNVNRSKLFLFVMSYNQPY